MLKLSQLNFFSLESFYRKILQKQLGTQWKKIYTYSQIQLSHLVNMIRTFGYFQNISYICMYDKYIYFFLYTFFLLVQLRTQELLWNPQNISHLRIPFRSFLFLPHPGLRVFYILRSIPFLDRKSIRICDLGNIQ